MGNCHDCEDLNAIVTNFQSGKNSGFHHIIDVGSKVQSTIIKLRESTNEFLDTRYKNL